MFATLGDNIFTYNKKEAAHQLAITLRKIIKHIRTIYGQEISNEIYNQTEVIIVNPVYDQYFLNKQVIQEGHMEANLKLIQDARRRKEAILQVALITDTDIHISLDALQNEME